MGLVVKAVIAFAIGALLLHGAQKYWMTKMEERINDPAQRVELPKSDFQMPPIDPNQMSRTMMQPAPHGLPGR